MKVASKSADNVFVQLGVADAEAHLIKAELVFRIDQIMRSRKMQMAEAAGLFGVPERLVSEMLRGAFREFSLERLRRFVGSMKG